MITHNAPPVVYPLGRSRFQVCVLAGLWCAGVCSVLFWVYSSQQIDWRIYSAGLAVIASGCAAFIGWKNTEVGQLVWDGQSWYWEGPAYQAGIYEQNISVIADFQDLLLIRLENPAKKSMCMWCERVAFPERWMDFRRAVFSTGRYAGNRHAVAVSGHADAVPVRVKP